MFSRVAFGRQAVRTSQKSSEKCRSPLEYQTIKECGRRLQENEDMHPLWRTQRHSKKETQRHP